MGAISPTIPKYGFKFSIKKQSFWCESRKYSTVKINATAAWGTYPISAFNRTWSKQYGFPIAHD